MKLTQSGDSEILAGVGFWTPTKSQSCIAMNDQDIVEEMSESQVERLTSELSFIRGALWAIGGVIAFLVTIIVGFGVVFYEQNTNQTNEVSRLIQRVDDLPKVSNDLQSSIAINTERVLTLQKVQASTEERMNLQGAVMNTIQQQQQATEHRLDTLEHKP